MSDQQGGPPRGPAPPAGTYGPGQTVLGVPVFPDDGLPPAPSVAMPYPPTTVRDGSLGAGAPALLPLAPLAVPPPPRATRGRRKRGAGPLLLGLGAVVVIGGAVTGVVLLRDAEDEAKPAPTATVPPVASAPADPGPPGAAPTDQPSAAPPPPTAPRPSFQRRPGPPSRPPNSYGPNGPSNPRYPPRRPR